MEMISVIVPIYKVEKYIPKCIESIINQTYRNLQIILVDDGSPDNSGAICDEYAKMDNRVTVIHKQNGGLSDARNAGIEAAEGEYLTFIDSDDYIALDMMEKLYNALINADADMSICSFRYVWEDESMTDEDKNNHNPIKDEVLAGKAILCDKMIEKYSWYWVVAWNKLYRRKLFDNIRYPLNKLHEDEFVIHRLLLKCDRVACISDMLYFYVQRQTSITNAGYSIRRLDVAEALLDRVEFMIEQHCYTGVLQYYKNVKLLLCTGYVRLDIKAPEAKKRLAYLKKRLNNLYRKTPKCLFSLKDILKIKFFMFSPKLYAKCIHV